MHARELAGEVVRALAARPSEGGDDERRQEVVELAQRLVGVAVRRGLRLWRDPGARTFIMPIDESWRSGRSVSSSTSTSMV